MSNGNVKVYLAGAVYNRTVINALSEALTRLVLVNTTIEIVSSWHKQPTPNNMQDCLSMDRVDIDNSDIIIATYPYGTGTSGEIGYGVGKGIPTYYFRDRLCTYDEHDPLFSHCEEVEHITSFDKLISVLREVAENG